ncbi:MAG: 3-deoxy-D-manno-octulosonate 8-phosphate phosphatase [Chitinophagaceae bacterium]|nr:3-deoxy-D-manno-octulosonate 8-phosphate phosphatase [Chitinophagaceae bacterium]MCW5926463.1 3-deoxy-D-manno-octulosonate 8-phosphate phosphatase [Chitinophagaceae bacterium]
MNILEKFRSIKTFVFDVDGVMTDGSIEVKGGREYIRTLNTKDGYALQLAVKKGFNIAVITGGYMPAVIERMNFLGIDKAYQSVKDKMECFEAYSREHGIDPLQTLYMGDDIPDYPVMKTVGLASCPLDAVPEVREISHYISPFNGGRGCVRDVLEKVLKLNGCWEVSADIGSI